MRNLMPLPLPLLHAAATLMLPLPPSFGEDVTFACAASAGAALSAAAPFPPCARPPPGAAFCVSLPSRLGAVPVALPLRLAPLRQELPEAAFIGVDELQKISRQAKRGVDFYSFYETFTLEMQLGEGNLLKRVMRVLFHIFSCKFVKRNVDDLLPIVAVS